MTTSSLDRSPIQAIDIDRLRTLVEVSTDAADLRGFATDASRARPDAPAAVVAFPKSVDEVSAVLTEANRVGVPVVTRGAGTGLSGGAVALAGCIVLSTRDLGGVEIDPSTRTASVGAGVITGDLDREAARFGLMFAPDPVSVDTSTIGGNIATNAGGPRCLSFGVTADAVRQLEVVLADGRIVHVGSPTVKNATGYDLLRLFIGSEGTLGVVTRAVVRLRDALPAHRVAFAISHPDLSAIGRLIERIVARPSLPVSLELMDANTIDLVSQHYGDIDLPLGSAVLAGEFAGDGTATDLEALEVECRRVGAVLATGDRARDILLTRMRVNPALNEAGLAASCDVVVPVHRVTSMLTDIEQISAAHRMRVNTFAHAGDGNLHPAVVVAPGDVDGMAAAERVLDDITHRAIELGGMISGEHGIGSLKAHHLDAQFDADTLGLMRQIKTALDPRGILNPGRGI